MEPACIKTTLLVFIAVFARRAESQTEHSISSYSTSETERCVCQPHVTINPPVCRRSVPMNTGTCCNCTTVREILREVSTNQETVFSEIQGLRRQLEELQVSVSALVGFHGPKWQLVFKGVAGTGIKLYGLWTNTAWDSGSEDYGNYRSETLYEAWNNGQLNIKQVKLSLYDQTGVKVELVFNGIDSDILSWFAKERLISSPWCDLTTTATTNYYSISGSAHSLLERRFFINRNYGGCSVDHGWLVVVEKTGVCSWESFNRYPVILYSTHSDTTNWQDAKAAGTLGVADYLTIHIDTE